MADNNRPHFPNVTLIIAVMLIVFTALALFVIRWADISRTSPPVLATLPDFTFVSYENKPFGLADMKGKITVVDFIFTNCHGPCPIMAVNMAELYRDFALTDKVQFVSISVDPERDTPKVLKEYAIQKGVDDPTRWVFLRAPIEDVIRVSEEGFLLAAEDLPGNHTTKFVLVDQLGQIRGYYDGTNGDIMRIIKEHIKMLAREMP